MKIKMKYLNQKDNTAIIKEKNKILEKEKEFYYKQLIEAENEIVTLKEELTKLKRECNIKDAIMKKAMVYALNVNI